MAGRSRLRPGALGLAFAAWDVWRRLPPKQRQQVLDLAREHGPKLAAKAMRTGRGRRGSGRPD